MDPENIDASALEDGQTRNIPGRDTLTDTMAVTVNKTNETLAEWEKLISEYKKLTGGKRMWFQEITPGLDEAEFYVASPPTKIPKSGKEGNSLATMAMNLIIDVLIGSDTKVEPTAGE